MKAAVYLRVSTQQQAGEDRTSLDEQRLACLTYAIQHDLDVVEEYRETVSAKTSARPEFQAMLSAARLGKFGAIVALADDRLWRGGAAMGNIEEVMERHGVEVHIVQRGISDLNTMEILAAVAGIDRRNIRERLLMGKRGAARAGRLPHGSPPYGLRRGEDGRPEIVESQAVVVRRMFELYTTTQMGMPAVSRRLYEEFGVRKRHQVLYQWLRNPAYKGELLWSGITIPSPPIVDSALWERANRQLASTRVSAKGAGNTKHVYELQKLAYCRQCGRLFTPITRRDTKTGRTTAYYRCIGYTPACREHPYLRADWLEPKVWNDVTVGLLRNRLAAHTLAKQIHGRTDNEALGTQIADAERDIARWQKKRDLLLDAYLENEIPRELFSHRMKYINEPLETANERLERLRAQVSENTETIDWWAKVDVMMRETARDYEASLDSLDAIGRRHILRGILRQVTLDANNKRSYTLNLEGVLSMPQLVTEASDRDLVSIASSPTKKKGIATVLVPVTSVLSAVSPRYSSSA